ncbi:MAG: hypothetical protein ACLSVD_07735 [Eggerthellaceae bacterium]
MRRLLENLATQRECAVLVSSHVLTNWSAWWIATASCAKRLVAQMTAEEVEEACRDYLCVETPKRPGLWRCLSAFPDACSP